MTDRNTTLSYTKTEADNRLLTWDEIVKLEPRVGELYRDVRKARDDKSKPSFCANAVWYGYRGHPGFKHRVEQLVGFETGPKQLDPRLRTMEAYDLVYQKCYKALPNCRNCACF